MQEARPQPNIFKTEIIEQRFRESSPTVSDDQSSIPIGEYSKNTSSKQLKNDLLQMELNRNYKGLPPPKPKAPPKPMKPRAVLCISK